MLLGLVNRAAERLILISNDGQILRQLPRQLQRPYAIAANEQRIAVASPDAVTVFANASALAQSYPNQPNCYDALYLPRLTYHCGEIGISDMAWLGDELWIASSRFSCLASLDQQYSFTPRWQPSFINELSGQSQCYLSGFACVDGQAEYATVWGQTAEANGWQKQLRISDHAVVADGLMMPTAPRWHNGKLYVLNSGKGQLLEIDDDMRIVCELESRLSGLAMFDDYAVIGLSKLSAQSPLATMLPLQAEKTLCGIVIVHLPTGKEAARLEYSSHQGEMDQIDALCLIKGIQRAGFVSLEQPIHHLAFTSPDGCFWAQ